MNYDCFVFNNELDLLSLRLHELDAVCGTFVLVEATRTFSGKPKPLVYHANRDRFSRWHRRIRHIVVEDLPDYPVGTPRMYETEGIQRDRISEGLYDAHPLDRVMMSDVDEIPRALSVRQAAQQGDTIFKFCQRTYYYFLTLRAIDFAWMYGTRMAPAYDALRMGGQALRTWHEALPMSDAGWHFSFFGTPEANRDKLGAWSHVLETDRPPMNDPAHFARCRREGIDWDVNRNAAFQWVPLDDSYPVDVVEHPEKYAEYIGPGAAVQPVGVA